MKTNRTFMITAAVLTLCAGLLTGCQKKNTEPEAGEEKLLVVSTIFPPYDWTREILGENQDKVELTLLIDSGTDLHSYQPTAEDIAKISQCDLFLYVGGESDAWVEDALKEADNKNLQTVNLLEALGDNVKEEELAEGMEAEEEEEHSRDGEEEEGPEYDEHVWLSLKNTKVLVKRIAQALEELDQDNKELYEKNCDSYMKELDSLDQEYQTAVDSAKRKTVLFGDRFPFRYLADDYGLEYYAAFPGCSAETEASFETVVFLSGKVDEQKLPAVLVLENSDQKLADTVIRSTKTKDQKVLAMNSLQSVTGKEAESGFTYLKAMKENLEILKQALN